MIANLDSLATATQRDLLTANHKLKLALQMVKQNLTSLTLKKTIFGQPNEPLVEDAQNIINEALK